MRIQLSDHFNYTKLLSYSLPSIIMTVIVSVYGIMDGLFVSNFAGKTPFAAISLILPFVFAMGSVGFMIGKGGAAVIAKTLGEQRQEKANQIFSMIIIFTVMTGIGLTAVGLFMIRPVAILMGAAGELLENSVLYGSIMLSFQAAFMVQTVFQSLLPVAEKPKLGLALTVISSIVDILLNALFIIVFGWGVVGAAVSSVIGQLIGSIVPVLYFLRRNDSLLRFVKPVFDGKALLKTCTNGSSEMVTSLSSSVVGVLSLMITGAVSILLTAVAIIFSGPIAGFFVGYDPVLLKMSHRAFALYAVSFLFCGFNIFASAFFTALNDGFISAVISFARTFLFQALAIIALPLFIGLDGIWLAVVAAEMLAMALAIFFFIRKKNQYHYA